MITPAARCLREYGASRLHFTSVAIAMFLRDVSTKNIRSTLKESAINFDRSINALVDSPRACGAVAAVDAFSATSVLSRSETYLGKNGIPQDYGSPPA